MAAERIRVNVGGTEVHTTRSTLCLRDSGSFFDVVLSGRFSERDEIFVDRDPALFPCVLEYLRSGMVRRALSPSQWAGLLAEAEFYGLAGLATAIRGTVQGEDVVHVTWRLEALKAASAHVPPTPAFVREVMALPGVELPAGFSAEGAILGVPAHVEAELARLVDNVGPVTAVRRKGVPDTQAPRLQALWEYFHCTVYDAFTAEGWETKSPNCLVPTPSQMGATFRRPRSFSASNWGVES